MVEMQIEDDRVERLRVQQMGQAWIQAIAERAFDRLEKFCLAEVTSRLLTPKRYIAFDNLTNLIDKYRQWFSACSQLEIQQSRVERVGERLGIFYRCLLQEQGEWFKVEQQLYVTLIHGQIADLQLLCSGFQPVGESGQAVPINNAGDLGMPANESKTPEGNTTSVRDDLLELYTASAKNGATCALLTPAIRAKLREMQSGQVLEVRVDDSSARADVESWCRLSGNVLLSISEGTGPDLRFFIKKK